LIDALGEQILSKACSQMRFLKENSFAETGIFSALIFPANNLLNRI